MPAASAYITHEKVFYEEWQPGDLGPREGKLQALAHAFKPLEYGGRPQHAVVTGPSGSGKTVMSRFLCDQIDSSDATDATTAFLAANAVPRRWSFHRALYEAIAGRAPDVQRASTATADLRRMVEEELSERGRPLVVVIDEADQLRDPEGVLYDLATMPHIVVCCIGSDAGPIFSSSDAVRSRLDPLMTIRCPAYSVDELVTILEARAEHGLQDDRWTPEALRAIAQHADGNARRAIRTLFVAAQRASETGARRITPQLAEQCLGDAVSQLREEALASATEDIRALYKVLDGADDGLRMGELYPAYCERVDEPVGERRVRDFLEKLESYYDVIDRRGSTSSRRYIARE